MCPVRSVTYVSDRARNRTQGVAIAERRAFIQLLVSSFNWHKPALTNDVRLALHSLSEVPRTVEQLQA
jgi:hypothetical protein